MKHLFSHLKKINYVELLFLVIAGPLLIWVVVVNLKVIALTVLIIFTVKCLMK